MKPEAPNTRKVGIRPNRRGMGMSQMPMEWMDPLSWRLPSGKALAEFALQTGFLAPLLMRAPQPKKKQELVSEPHAAMNVSAAESKKGLEEAPMRTANFRHHR